MSDLRPSPAHTSNQAIPEQNLKGYSTIYGIENVLRELVIEVLAAIAGERWYKVRLPGDILGKYREAIGLQRQVKWSSLTPHHPIYYVDFPDLRKVIEREENWNQGFRSIFSRKDIISATLSEIEPIRNSLAHCRKISLQELELLRAASAKLESAIGEERFARLAGRSSIAVSISEDLRRLSEELEECRSACGRCGEVASLSQWTRIKNEWWFDESYLGHETGEIERCYQLLIEYASLERHRGCGHVIETWIRASGVADSILRAQESLKNFISIAKE
jgi:hypothetical protein